LNQKEALFFRSLRSGSGTLFYLNGENVSTHEVDKNPKSKTLLAQPFKLRG